MSTFIFPCARYLRTVSFPLPPAGAFHLRYRKQKVEDVARFGGRTPGGSV